MRFERSIRLGWTDTACQEGAIFSSCVSKQRVVLQCCLTKRDFSGFLQDWLKSRLRLPLVIRGASQVGKAAFEMINEILRQFREISGLLEGTAKPDTERCIDIATTAALKKMMLPGVIAVAAPPVVGLLMSAEALGGMLAGALLGCVLLALTMANVDGAWDNAKKYVEKGHHGGKGSDTHTATVVGDTVGDPFKDTSGPSMNILINVMAIVSLLIPPLL